MEERTRVMALGDSFDAFVLTMPSAIADMAKSYTHFVSQAHWTTIDGQLAVDAVLRFESLGDDWVRLMATCGRTDTLPLTNASSHDGWRQCVSLTAQDRIRFLYSMDFELFYPDEA